MRLWAWFDIRICCTHILGTGFKLGPVTGEMLADIAVGNETKYERKPFSASRFQSEDYNISKAPEKTERSRL